MLSDSRYSLAWYNHSDLTSYSLNEDQVTNLKINGIKAAYYNSSLSGVEARNTLRQLHNGELDLLYISPERLLTASFMERLNELNINLFAIDEATAYHNGAMIFAKIMQH